MDFLLVPRDSPNMTVPVECDVKFVPFFLNSVRLHHILLEKLSSKSGVLRIHPIKL